MKHILYVIMSTEREDALKYYFDTEKPGSLGGVRSFAKAIGISPTKAREWLSYEPAYTVHKPRRIRFRRNRMIAMSVDENHQADLVDLQSLAKFNSNFKYLLVIIDVLSRYVWVSPLKTKTGPETAAAFEKIYKKGRIPKRLCTDKGKEFENQHVQRIMKKYKIKFYVTHSDTKAAMVERVNRTIKGRMWRWFTKNRSYRYLEVLPKLIQGYNNSIHRVIGTTPSNVTKENEHLIWYKLYGKKEQKPKPKFRVDDLVRVSNPKMVFDKAYRGTYSEEIFVIKDVLKRDPIVYHLKDRSGEEILGIFYEAELLKVGEYQLPDNQYDVERVIKRRKKNGVEQLFVKWRGYSDSENSWIPATDLKSYG